MEWVKPVTKSNGLPRKHFRSLKIPSTLGIKDGQLVTLRIDIGEESVTDTFSVSSGEELQLSKILADKIESVAKSNPQGLIKFTAVGSSDGTELEDINAVEPELDELLPTERKALIDARLGQGRFRTDLLRVWNSSCAVTEVRVPALLRASHIKPWSKSDNRERLDPNNGLLLIANLDAAFDKRLISFDASGGMLFSAELGRAPHLLLGIRPGSRLTKKPSLKQQIFLEAHRSEIKLD